MIMDPQSPGSELYFLKLGGSLITDKSKPHTPRQEVLARLAEEIATALQKRPNLRLVLGHGSGSFGHVAGHRYGTRQGVASPEGWRGFAEVWREAAALNHFVMDALHTAGLPAVAFSPLAAVLAADAAVKTWNLEPLRLALQAGLLPVVYGDVALDEQRGGTILSTEDLFAHLALHFSPQRILLAGLEEGVWADFPACQRLVEEITPGSFAASAAALSGSAATDVTGGMRSKVQHSLELVQTVPGLEILIFSGEAPGRVESVLLGEKAGTRLTAGPPPKP
jgi:isopentenyl phosphate kinase